MKPGKKLFLLFLSAACCSFTPFLWPAAGDTVACKWKDNKKGAFLVAYDITYWSEKNVALPLHIQKGVTASFYISPGLARYAYGIDTWETQLNRYGFGINNAQMEHKFNGWADYTEAQYEVGEAARRVWMLRPPGMTLLTPMSQWPSPSDLGLTTAQWDELKASYHILREGDTAMFNYIIPDDWTAAQMTGRAQNCINDGGLRGLWLHGVGQYGEYDHVTTLSDLTTLLDFLAANSGKLWVGNDIDVYQYKKEYDSSSITVLESSPTRIRLNLTSSEDPYYFRYPLTLIAEVPSGWAAQACKATQNGIDAKKIYPVNVWPSSATVMFEAIPSYGEIWL